MSWPLLLLLLSNLLLPWLSSQEIKIRVQVDFRLQDTGGKTYWYFPGKIDFAYNTRLAFHLVFKGSELRGSRGYRWARKGAFLYRYGPIPGKIMSGEYQLRIVFSRSLQLPEVQKNKNVPLRLQFDKSFLIGTPHLERAEIRAAGEFYRSFLQKSETFLQNLQQKTQEFLLLKAPDGLEAMKTWLLARYSTWQRQQQLLQQQSYPVVLAPHFPQSLQNARAILSLAKILLKLHQQQLQGHYKLLQPGQSRLETQEFAATVANYRQRIARLANAIRKALPYPANLNESDIASDLEWQRQLFAKLQRQYSIAAAKFDAGRWRQMVDYWQIEFADFELRINDYAASPLAKEYPQLLADWQQLQQYQHQLLAGYTAILYEANGLELPAFAQKAKAPRDLLKPIETLLTRLQAVVNEKQRQEAAQKKQRLNGAQQGLQQLRKLCEQLQQQLSRQGDNHKEFAAWYQQWQQQLQAIVAANQALKHDIPEVPRYFNAAVYWLQAQAKLHARSLQQENPIKNYDIYMRQHQLRFELVTRKIERCLQQKQK